MKRTSTRSAAVLLASAGAVVCMGGVAQAAGSACTPGSSVDTTSSSCLPTNVQGVTFTKTGDGGAPADGAVAATTVQTSDGLPFTGANVIPLVLGGGVLLVGGAGLVTAGSRRRRAE